MSKVLASNQYISLLDVSENFMGEEGAHSLLKALNNNKFLNHIYCEKVQIPIRLKKDIDEKVRDNRSIKLKK